MKVVLGMVAVLALGVGASAEMRTWTTRSGRSVDGEYVSVVFDRIVVRDAAGRDVKFAKDELSDKDRDYVELVNPPQLDVDFLKSVAQIQVKPSPMWVNNSPVTILRYTFGARVRQTDSSDYNHDLTVEVFAVARQVYDPDKYHLVSRWKSEPFRLTGENKHRHECHGPKKVDLPEFLLAGEYPRGQKYAECLIVVRDERGEVVAFRTTKNWLYENLEQLADLPVGAWFDKSCRRVHPSSPKPVWLD